MRLILLRHAKSSWDDPALPDRDRPLGPRGVRDAPRMGAWIAAHPPLPDRILVSDAARTVETWDRLGLPGTPERRGDLYHAEAEAIRAVAGGATDGTTLLIGHNDGIGAAAARLCRTPPGHPRFDRYPTGACLVVRFDGAVAWGAGSVEAFAVPKDLG